MGEGFIGGGVSEGSEWSEGVGGGGVGRSGADSWLLLFFEKKYSYKKIFVSLHRQKQNQLITLSRVKFRQINPYHI